MLGDGCLYLGRSSINAHLIMGRSIKDEDYMRYEMGIFENFLPPRYKGIIPHYSMNRFSTSYKLTKQCDFATVASPTFTPYYNLWYKEIDGKRRKIVPNSLKLNGQIVAHWLADDGSTMFNKLPYRLKAEFSTHGFSKDEVEFLASLMNDRYNEEFLVRPKNRWGKTYYIIKAYDSACRAMFLDIDPYFKMDRKRIWDRPESRFWENQPERQRSMVHDLENRKIKLAKIIDNGEPITMIQLAKRLVMYIVMEALNTCQ